jgi:outer membrane lipoprotein-sorting protein
MAVAALAAAGCAAPERATRELTLGPAQVVDRVEGRGEMIRSVKGDGVVTIESPEQSGSTSFELNLRKPDSLMVSLSGPFGIRFGVLSFSRDRFVFYNYQDNYAFVGKSDGSTLHEMFNLRMKFDEVLRAFTGEFFTSRGDSLESFRAGDGGYIFVYRSGDLKREYRVDGQEYFVTSYRVLDAAGRPTLTAIASEPDETGPMVIPRLLRVIFPGERRSITVAYSGMEINVPVSCSFTLPKSADIFYR